ncbi:MAG TPA: GreA/GreB family elongation factor [Longimicrobium sp.]|nr:GreA/GreB family elongation factor [Longimicrobium sp.]
MTDVVPIHGCRAPGAEWNERVAELRERLGSELEELSNELMLGMNARLAGRAAGGVPDEPPRDGPVHRRIRLLGQLISGLEAAEPGTLWDERAGYGSTVFVRDLQSGEETFYTLMTGNRVDDEANQVPLGSPLGLALLGCRPGDEPVVQTPRGPRNLRVFAVHTLPQSLGMLDPGPGGAA